MKLFDKLKVGLKRPKEKPASEKEGASKSAKSALAKKFEAKKKNREKKVEVDEMKDDAVEKKSEEKKPVVEEKKSKKPLIGKRRLKHELAEAKKQRKEQFKRKRMVLWRKNVGTYLFKAGFPDASVEKLRRRIFQIALATTSGLWFATLITMIVNGRTLSDFVMLSIGIWTAIFFFIWILALGVFSFWLEMRIYRRTKELEDVLPDFLQLASANISAGMPIDRALWFAIRPQFGVLSREIEDVAKSTISGEDLSRALENFVNKYDSMLLKRSISILLEGLDAGGELADLLNKIALNIQELKIMKKEMAANVTTYVIFISFASIIIAPVLFALASQLIEIIINITSNISLGGAASSLISMSPSSDRGVISDFRIYCIAMLSVTAGMSACIIAVIQKGSIKEAVKNIPLFIIIALIIYFLAVQGLGVTLGSLL